MLLFFLGIGLGVQIGVRLRLCEKGFHPVYIQIHAYMSTGIYICACTHECMYVGIHADTYTYTHFFTYIHRYQSAWRSWLLLLPDLRHVLGAGGRWQGPELSIRRPAFLGSSTLVASKGYGLGFRA